MQQLIVATFLIIIIFSALNLIANTFLYLSSRKQSLYFQLSLFWASLIINFVLQSLASNSEQMIILLYGYAVIPINILSYISLKFIDKRYPIKRFISFTIFNILLTLVFFQFQLDFTLKALPMAFATGAPLVYAFYKITIKNWSTVNPLIKLHSAILLLQGVHCFNFAFFRMQEDAQLWGWPVSYALYLLIATTLPAITLSFFHNQENNRLKEIVRLRTKKIETAMEQKEHVFKVLSHDISNPLSILKLSLGLHSKGLKDDKQIVEVAKKMSDRITNLIEQTRALNQVDVELNEIPSEKLMINESLRRVKSYFQENLQAKELTLVLDLNTNDDLYIMNEKNSFENSVISNFISNSIKFSKPNDTITIKSRSDQDSVYIDIKDTGIGIPSDILELIFNYNSIKSRNGTNNEPGNGLGMPIAKKYIDFFKGSVQIQSKEQSESESGYTLVRLEYPKEI